MLDQVSSVKKTLDAQVIDKPGEDKNTKGMSIAVVSIVSIAVVRRCSYAATRLQCYLSTPILRHQAAKTLKVFVVCSFV